jgi:hypothetical protein
MTHMLSAGYLLNRNSLSMGKIILWLRPEPENKLNTGTLNQDFAIVQAMNALGAYSAKWTTGWCLDFILALSNLLNLAYHHLQWCLRLPSQNSVSQPVQRFTAWSGTHRVGPVSRSSTASHDTSEGRDSPAEGCSPLHTDSGSDPC